MKVAAITLIANGDTDKELAMLEKEAENSSTDIEVYIRLSQLHRSKENYQQAMACLHKAEKMLMSINTSKAASDYNYPVQ